MNGHRTDLRLRHLDQIGIHRAEYFFGHRTESIGQRARQTGDRTDLLGDQTSRAGDLQGFLSLEDTHKGAMSFFAK